MWLTGGTRPRREIRVLNRVAAMLLTMDMRIIAFVTDTAPVARILTHFGEPPRPPPITPTRGPPAWEDAPQPMPDWDLLGQPEPDFEFDQRVAW